MATVHRFQRLIADHVHHDSDHAAWWELAVYWLVALLACFAMASAFTFAFPRVMASF